MTERHPRLQNVFGGICYRPVEREPHPIILENIPGKKIKKEIFMMTIPSGLTSSTRHHLHHTGCLRRRWKNVHLISPLGVPPHLDVLVGAVDESSFGDQRGGPQETQLHDSPQGFARQHFAKK